MGESKMASATQGPWRVGESFCGVGMPSVDAVKDGIDIEICLCHGTSYSDEPDDESFANARLIAAAPEMLAALRAIVIESGGKAIPNESLTACRNRALAAIAKAEGRSDA